MSVEGCTTFLGTKGFLVKHANDAGDYGYYGVKPPQGGGRRTRRKTSQKRRKSSQRKTRRGK